jgi:DNA mismatch repair protein MutL
MNRIRLLTEQVANQIAAGEVVERPASVVKELVENALDAQATRITVEVQAGGRSLVRVTDDGLGMSRDDALLCLERHATSKIQRAEDLSALTTMGFRGEALPSIASVSRFTLTTRERASDAPEGTRVVVQGGKILEVKAAGSAPGTCLEVRQIFFNLPARRKFLRSEETEAAHIQHYLTLAALAYPTVAFTFVKDDRTVWQLAAARTGADPTSPLAALGERLRAFHGQDLKLLPVDFAAELRVAGEAESGNGSGSQADLATDRAADTDGHRDDCRDAGRRDTCPTNFRVWGFIGAPGMSRATREDQHLFVNRRPVENRGLNFALLEGYHTALMKGRYPVCCLFVEIDPAAVDVNIHPTKREVKFHREFEVRRLVAQAVRQTLLGFHADPAGPTQVPRAKPAVGTPPPAPTPGPALAQKALPHFPEPVPRPPGPAPLAGSGGQRPLPMGFTSAVPEPPPPVPTGPHPAPTAAASPPAATSAARPPSPQSPPPAPPSPPPGAPVPLLKVPLRLVGVIGRLYVLLESERGLVLLDQHAAHERVLFEQMLNRLEQSQQAAAQHLLLPETIELSPRDAQFLREQLPVLTRLGVGLAEFGERTFLLDALPPFVKAGDPRRFVLDLIDELKAAGHEVNTLRLGEHTVAKTVCRHAVKANDPLQGAELESLIEELRQCAMPYTCPHGRPTILEMSWRELEKKFGRTQ